MRQSDIVPFAAFALLLLGFLTNLVLARSGSAIFGNIMEMLILFGAAACFGIGTLLRENRRQD